MISSNGCRCRQSSVEVILSASIETLKGKSCALSQVVNDDMLSFTLENCSVEKQINSKIDANIFDSSTSNNNDYSEIIEPIREYLKYALKIIII